MRSATPAREGQKSKHSCLLRLQLLERVNLDELHERVELRLGILVLVSLARDSDADSARDVSDASGPDLTVQHWVNAHFLYHPKQSDFENNNGASTPL